MALINCPECGREVSDKAVSCPGCGFPINEYLEKQKMIEKEEQEKMEEIERLKPLYFCKSCNNQNEIGEDYCSFCGNRLTPYASLQKSENENVLEKNQSDKKEFNGVYRYSLFNGKQEVYCPRCGSENCSHYKEQKIIPAKTKTSYTLNLNPLHPFTFVNKKEKVKKEEQVITERKFVCNSCGKIFK